MSCEEIRVCDERWNKCLIKRLIEQFLLMT